MVRECGVPRLSAQGGRCRSASLLERVEAALGYPYADDGHDQEDDGQDDCELEKRLFQAASGAKAGLGAAEEPSARLSHLEKYDHDEHYRHENLSDVES